MTVDSNDDHAIDERTARLRWPDGPVCPFCGAREAFVPERGRVRYECPECGGHRGYVREPGASSPPEGAPPRRSVVPRFPRGA